MIIIQPQIFKDKYLQCDSWIETVLWGGVYMHVGSLFIFFEVFWALQWSNYQQLDHNNWVWQYKSRKKRLMLKIKGIIFKLIHCLQSLSNPGTLSASDSNAECSFCLCNPILLCRPSEEHYCIVKCMNIDLLPPWELTWMRLYDKGLTDVWCAGAWLYTLRWIHPWSMYPQVYIMRVLRNLGIQSNAFFHQQDIVVSL